MYKNTQFSVLSTCYSFGLVFVFLWVIQNRESSSQPPLAGRWKCSYPCLVLTLSLFGFWQHHSGITWHLLFPAHPMIAQASNHSVFTVTKDYGLAKIQSSEAPLCILHYRIRLCTMPLHWSSWGDLVLPPGPEKCMDFRQISQEGHLKSSFSWVKIRTLQKKPTYTLEMWGVRFGISVIWL